jgi:hypothetical protein
MEGQRQISTEAGAMKAEELKALFLETSARDGTNISEIFCRIG